MSADHEPKDADASPAEDGGTHADERPVFQHQTELRVRYSETDQMGTFYNSRVLEWFECGRTELLRALGLPYAELETRGLFFPLVEAHIVYEGRARYDDLLRLMTSLRWAGRARVRLDVVIVQAANSRGVARGYTVHAFTDREGRPIRPPEWFRKGVERHAAGPQPRAESACQSAPVLL